MHRREWSLPATDRVDHSRARSGELDPFSTIRLVEVV